MNGKRKKYNQTSTGLATFDKKAKRKGIRVNI